MQVVHRTRGADPRKRGAALMLSMLVLLVLVAIVFQINVATSTDARIARNDVSLTAMDLAAESALLLKFDQLLIDGESDAEGDGGLGGIGGGGLGDSLGGAGGLGGAGDEQGASGPVDSREDDWARVESTDALNDLRMRILVQDENSKYNVLSMLDPDPARAEAALARVVRVLDLFREGSDLDLDRGQAERMAELMVEHFRAETELARPRLSTDVEDEPELGKPSLTLRELVAYPEFEPELFRDFRTEDGTIVHSLTSYLTVWSSLTTFAEWEEQRQAAANGATGAGAGTGVGASGGQGGGQGQGSGQGSGQGGGIATTGGNGSTAFSAQADTGDASGTTGLGGGGAGAPEPAQGLVNINTAPPVVLKALMDDYDVDPRFWDDVIKHRNEEDESQVDTDEEPILDEFGEEAVPLKFFSSVDELVDMPEWENIEPIFRDQLRGLVGVSSDVFTIYVTVQRDTSQARGQAGYSMSREEYEEQLFSLSNLTRTIACTVWRRSGEEGIELVPLQRWEYLDYIPYEVLDYPEEER